VKPRALRDNILLQYTAATLGIVLAITVILGTTLNRRIEDYQIRSHIQIFPEVVRLTVGDLPEFYGVFRGNSPDAIPPRVVALFREFLSLGTVFRVKIWGRDGMILWSDQLDLIGQSFADNDGFQEAMKGTVSYENTVLSKSENIDERSKGRTLEIYTPVTDGSRVLGVVELYEANSDLFVQIARNTRFTWLLVVIAGVLLWALLFFIFLAAYRRQRRTNAELHETQNVTIFALAYQAELRDRQTGRHLERTALYVRILAEELARSPAFRAYLKPGYIEDLVKAAPLHDIGKVGIADAILLKPGKLTPQEMEEIRKHCDYGARVLRRAEEKLKFQSFLSIAIQLTLYHHEKWDGTGYPHGLRGDAIPLSGRIMALADNYDALRTQRPYKEPIPHDESRRMIVTLAGIHFDPALVAAFQAREAEFRSVSESLAD
jgi:HD-GYP domain-containing protein (c-di-GMP phosphodiesterase class II)